MSEQSASFSQTFTDGAGKSWQVTASPVTSSGAGGEGRMLYFRDPDTQRVVRSHTYLSTALTEDQLGHLLAVALRTPHA